MDKSKFEEMFKLRVKQHVALKETEILERNSKHVEELKAQANSMFEEERKQVRDVLKAMIDQQYVTMQSSITKVTVQDFLFCLFNPQRLSKNTQTNPRS